MSYTIHREKSPKNLKANPILAPDPLARLGRERGSANRRNEKMQRGSPAARIMSLGRTSALVHIAA